MWSAIFAGALLVGSFLGAVATIRTGVIKPLHKTLTRAADVWELPDLVRDIISTWAGYMADTETRLARAEHGLHVIMIRLGIIHDDDHPGD